MSGPGYGLKVTDRAFEQLVGLNERVFARIEQALSLLRAMPRMGRRYDPPHAASLPPLECMAYYVPRTTKVLFYLLDEEEQRITLFLIGDSRSDPMTTFVGLHLSDLE